ncbi:MAG: hypothetical protein L6309_02765, partial [Candidatus Omnitrophica bacterium]|nr:hypothetical protein [Candidatus Omnitrophota bacterium]
RRYFAIMSHTYTSLLIYTYERVIFFQIILKFFGISQDKIPAPDFYFLIILRLKWYNLSFMKGPVQ